MEDGGQRTATVNYQWISRAKLAVAMAVIKIKPSSLTGQDYARVLSQQVRKKQSALVASNKRLKDENQVLLHKLMLSELGGGDSGFSSGLEPLCLREFPQRHDSTVFEDHISFFQALACLKSHMKTGPNCSISSADTLSKSLAEIFQFLKGKWALSLPEATLAEVMDTLVAICDRTGWPRDVSFALHVSFMEFVEDLLRTVAVVGMQEQWHYTRLLCQLGRSCHLWEKLCNRLVNEVQAFAVGQKDPVHFRAIYCSLHVLENLWDQRPLQRTGSFPGEAWASVLEQSLRFTWEQLPLFHIYVSFLHARLARLTKSMRKTHQC